MSNYIQAGHETAELADAIQTNKAHTLLRELNFRFGLRVLCTYSWGDAHLNTGFIMTRSQGDMAGFPVGMAYVSSEYKLDADGNRVWTDKYNFYSHYVAKERGRTDRDRRTWSSIKMSSLMSTIKKHDVLPDDNLLFDEHIRGIRDGVKRVMSKLGSTYKPTDIDSDQLHKLLRHMFDGAELTAEETTIYKTQLDKYNEVDKTIETKLGEVVRMFGKEFYAVGVNKLGDIAVGTLRFETDVKRLKGSYADTDQFKVIKSFKHIKSIDEVPELIPVMTMLKVCNEGSGRELLGGCIPLTEHFFQDLDLVTAYHSYPSEYSYVWALTPCQN